MTSYKNLDNIIQKFQRAKALMWSSKQKLPKPPPLICKSERKKTESLAESKRALRAKRERGRADVSSERSVGRSSKQNLPKPPPLICKSERKQTESLAESKRALRAKRERGRADASSLGGARYLFLRSNFVRSFMTSPAIISPTTDGTNALEPGISRRTVHFLVSGGQTQ